MIKTTYLVDIKQAVPGMTPSAVMQILLPVEPRQIVHPSAAYAGAWVARFASGAAMQLIRLQMRCTPGVELVAEMHTEQHTEVVFIVTSGESLY